MKNKKRKQERQARLERDDFENRIREEQTKHRHIDRTKVLLGSGGDVASDSEDEFDEAYQGQFGEVLEKEAKAKNKMLKTILEARKEFAHKHTKNLYDYVEKQVKQEEEIELSLLDKELEALDI